MKSISLLTTLSVLMLLAGCSGQRDAQPDKAQPGKAQTRSARNVSTGNAFYGDPPTEHRPWTIHDRNRPQPPQVDPGTFSTPAQPGKPPSDAIVLFDGTAASLANWETEPKDGGAPGPVKWLLKDGALECAPKSGNIRTKRQFGDCQLHVEWAAPTKVQGDSQGRGNSGIFLMGICEVQVLDNYDNPTYADGFANSVYGVNPPMANPLRPPGEYQVVDIVFRRPVFKDGKLVEAGRVTVFCNGVVMQDGTPVIGENFHKVGWMPKVFPDAGPLKFQDHNNPVRFRNIWYRPLPPRPIDGGVDGDLTTEATAAVRKQIAAAVRQDAARLPANSTGQMLRLAESLVYEKDAATAQQFDQMAAAYAAKVKALTPAQVEANKGEIQTVLEAFRYLAKYNFVPVNFGPRTDLEQVVKAAGWNKGKK